MKPIKLNGDLKNFDVKNGLFNKSLINGFCLLRDVLCKSQAMKKNRLSNFIFFYVFFGFLILKLVYWSIFTLI
jgi:hypothetical protein